jgi:hypothetical protein
MPSHCVQAMHLGCWHFVCQARLLSAQEDSQVDATGRMVVVVVVEVVRHSWQAPHLPLAQVHLVAQGSLWPAQKDSHRGPHSAQELHFSLDQAHFSSHVAWWVAHQGKQWASIVVLVVVVDVVDVVVVVVVVVVGAHSLHAPHLPDDQPHLVDHGSTCLAHQASQVMEHSRHALHFWEFQAHFTDHSSW